MEWTEQKPTAPGFYWYWRVETDELYVVEIIWAGKEGGRLAMWQDETGPSTLESVSGWFMGPLEHPEPPTKGE